MVGLSSSTLPISPLVSVDVMRQQEPLRWGVTLIFNIGACVTALAHVAFVDYLESNKYQSSRLAQAIFFSIESFNHLSLFCAIINGIILPYRSGFGTFESVAAIVFGAVFFLVQNVYISSLVKDWKQHTVRLQAEQKEKREEERKGRKGEELGDQENDAKEVQAYPGNPSIAFVAIAQQLFPFSISLSVIMLVPTVIATGLQTCGYLQELAAEPANDVLVTEDVEKGSKPREPTEIVKSEKASGEDEQEEQKELPKNNLTKLEVGIYMVSFGVNLFLFFWTLSNPSNDAFDIAYSFGLIFGFLLLLIDLSTYKNYIIDSIPTPPDKKKDLKGVCCCCCFRCNFGCSSLEDGIFIYASVGRIEGYVIIVFGAILFVISGTVDVLSISLLFLEYIVVQARMSVKLFSLSFKDNDLHGVTGMMRDYYFGFFPFNMVVPDATITVAEILSFFCSIEFVLTHSIYALRKNKVVPKLDGGPLEFLNCLDMC